MSNTTQSWLRSLSSWVGLRLRRLGSLTPGLGGTLESFEGHLEGRTHFSRVDTTMGTVVGGTRDIDSITHSEAPNMFLRIQRLDMVR